MVYGELIVAGSAGSAPGPIAPCSGYLIRKQGFELLLDLGPGASMTLQRHVDPADVDAVILSHGHSDHWADLTQMFRLRVDRTTEPLPAIGPAAMSEWLDDHGFAYMQASAEPRALGPVRVRQAQVQHGDVECWATRLDDALCFTADTEPCEALDDLAAGVGVLLAEACGSDTNGPMPGHLTAGDAARLAARSGVRLLVLTHMRPWDDHAALLAEAAAIAPCPVIAAVPDLRVAL